MVWKTYIVRDKIVGVEKCIDFIMLLLGHTLFSQNYVDIPFYFIAVNRLDRLTSGIVLIALTKEKAVEMEVLLKGRAIFKEYLCRVKGNFMEGCDQEIVCEMPVKIISHKLGLCSVADDGKPCTTIFKRLKYNGTTSLVSCRPLTGRMHQIRVHLLWLGYPIANDSVYNEKIWNRIVDNQGHVSVSLNPDFTPKTTRNQPDVELESLPMLCEECLVTRKDPQTHQLCIWLHALNYSTSTWSFRSSVPNWALDEFNEDQNIESMTQFDDMKSISFCHEADEE